MRLPEKIVEPGIGVLAGGALNHSISTLKYIPHNRNELWYLLRALGRFRTEIRADREYDFINSLNMTPQQASLAYILSNEHISSAVFNTLNTDHLAEKTRSVEFTLNADLINKIEGRDPARN